jgi:hypothetical protein
MVSQSIRLAGCSRGAQAGRRVLPAWGSVEIWTLAVCTILLAGSVAVSYIYKMPAYRSFLFARYAGIVA